ncbi:MAG: zinc-regulated TonB-dependent outer membrane receptor [Myxococcaceae bacterium]|nr:zinc-regulated TonB-dependent outer membrane receptor [Myxococcaceae bacterium]MCI0671801.1 zinc-regulated TonB-dependent outer membrane receptor [Myxococcaceae bacterium]
MLSQLVCAVAWAQEAPAREKPAAPTSPPTSPLPPGEGQSEGAADPAPSLSEEDQKALNEAFGKAPEDGSAEPPAPANPPQGPGGLLSSLPISGLDISFVLDAAGAVFSDKQPLQTGGHDPQKNGFTLQQLELSLGAAVDPFLRFDGNIVFSQFGVEIEEAYATSLGIPGGLQLRGGQFLTRFGRLNNTHPHAWDFVDQPFMVGRVFGGEGNRGLGLEASWLLPLPWSVELVGSATDATGEATARSFFGPDPARVVGPLDVQLTGAVKQFFELSDDVALLWGLSAATGPNASGFGTRSDVYGTDLFLKWRPLSGAGQEQSLTLQVEGLYRRRQIAQDLLLDGGGYAQAVWRFTRQWATGVRYELGTPAVRLEGGAVVLDPLDPEWTKARQRVSANLTFWPTEFSRFRLQGAVDAPGWRPNPIYSVFLAGEIVVGAHGSHPF